MRQATQEEGATPDGVAASVSLSRIPFGLGGQAIWLTPLLTRPKLGSQIRQRSPHAPCYVGTTNPWYAAHEIAALAVHAHVRQAAAVGA